MLRDDLFSLLSQRLGNRADLISRMETEVQLLQDTVLEQHAWLPWFLETEIATATTTVGDERVLLPVDFLIEIEEEALWVYVDTEENPYSALKKMPYDAMIARYPGPGRPYAYALGGNYFLLRYIPDAEYIVKMRYMAKDDALTTNIQNKWLKFASDVVLAELGIVFAEKHMQHFELAQTFRADATAAWNRLYSVHVARQEANLSRVMEA